MLRIMFTQLNDAPRKNVMVDVVFDLDMMCEPHTPVHDKKQLNRKYIKQVLTKNE